MGFIEDFGHKIYSFMTNPKLVKFSTFIGLGIFISAIGIGVIVAVSFGGTVIPPGAYNIFDNYISDMGSLRYTPTTVFLDFGNMISSILLVPCVFYLEKNLNPIPKKVEVMREISRMKFRLSSLGFVCMIFGLIGMFGTGLFSEDRTTAWDLHWVFTIVVFMGFATTGFFYGSLITFYETFVPKILGVYMIIGPSIIAAILFSLGFQPLHEWMMLGSLFLWIIPLALLSLQEINKTLKTS